MPREAFTNTLGLPAPSGTQGETGMRVEWLPYTLFAIPNEDKNTTLHPPRANGRLSTARADE